MHPRHIALLYSKAHDLMRNIDGLQPQEAFDELLKYMFFKQTDEENNILSHVKDSADQIQKRFASYVKKRNSWFSDLWKDRRFHLSDNALDSIHDIFAEVKFSKIPYDMRAAAMRQFLSPEIRRGLGIYLTPDEVVREAIAFLSPTQGSSFIDPACGSGTFVIETAHFWNTQGANKPYTLWAADKNPRMLLLAELNLEHMTGVSLQKRLMDSLGGFESIDWDKYKEGSFDFIGTNPPFGVQIDAKSIDLGSYATGCDEEGHSLKRQQSEIIFLERCLQLLRPGGRLAIVLPKSAMSNMRLDVGRKRLGDLGFIYAAFALPPETFAAYGTQTNTVVLFVERYNNSADKDRLVDVAIANINNVGYDLTGRQRDGSQIPGLHRVLQDACQGKSTELVQVYKGIRAKDTFAEFASLGSSRTDGPQGKKLSDIAEIIALGKTPARNAYVDAGLFIIKVGNLTGGGINWVARDRNFVDGLEASKRRKARKAFIVQEHDILMTSSAHSPVYIAKKVDIITAIPEWVGGEATFVGEVLMVRPNKKEVDPFSLLAFLRHPSTVDQIQRMVRGQTAHLHPGDLGNLVVPDKILSRNSGKLLDAIKEESRLNERLNEIARQQIEYAEQESY